MQALQDVGQVIHLNPQPGCDLRSIMARTFFQNHSGSTRIAEAIISFIRADAASGSLIASGRAWA